MYGVQKYVRTIPILCYRYYDKWETAKKNTTFNDKFFSTNGFQEIKTTVYEKKKTVKINFIHKCANVVELFFILKNLYCLKFNQYVNLTATSVWF